MEHEKDGPCQSEEGGGEIKMQQVFMAGVTISKSKFKNELELRLGFNLSLKL